MVLKIGFLSVPTVSLSQERTATGQDWCDGLQSKVWHFYFLFKEVVVQSLRQ